MKKHLSTFLLVLVFLLGACILLYPTVSDHWNSLHQTRVIGAYEDTLANMTQKDYSESFKAADAYNAALAKLNFPMAEYKSLKKRTELTPYEELLDVNGVGIMGYIDIDAIGVELPIYHGTDSSVLNIAVGHLQGSSLPVGGESTHCVLSAHRGLPSARLFTDLDRLKEGDTFTLSVLNRLLTYEIDQILIVKPEEVDALAIEPGKDYVTLMTCTPYAVNTHRLLVRGVRVPDDAPTSEPESEPEKEPLDARRMLQNVVLPATAGILFVIMTVLLLKVVRGGRRKK